MFLPGRYSLLHTAATGKGSKVARVRVGDGDVRVGSFWVGSDSQNWRTALVGSLPGRRSLGSAGNSRLVVPPRPSP